MGGDSGTGADADKVPNNYLAVLIGGRTGADGRGDTIRSALNAVTLALEAGAWKSTTATQFGQVLGHQRSTLQSLGDQERTTIDDEVAKQQKEPEVPKGDWRANFAYLSAHLR
jgi:hypothetical protein